MSDDPTLDAAYALATPADNLRLYGTWAKTYDTDFIATTGYRWPTLVAQAYLDMGGTWPCLDVGCGTGAVAEQFPQDAVIDGLDLSPEMLAVAAQKARYRHLIEADLTGPLPLDDARYSGLVSAGTFTHGHVGPDALPKLMRLLVPGAAAVITIGPDLWVEQGFEPMVASLLRAGLIERPSITQEPIYAETGHAPEGHAEDIGLIMRFRRL